MNGGTRRRASAQAESARLERWKAEEARWRRDQRTRRRRVTRRGQATLLSFGAALLFSAVWLLDSIAAVPSDATAEDRLPGVGAAAPPPGVPHPPDAGVQPDVPDAVLARVPITRAALDLPVTGGTDIGPSAGTPGRLYEELAAAPNEAGGLTVEYTLDAELNRHVHKVLRQARVALGNVIVLEPVGGRVLAYAATDAERFPPTRSYPAASLIKVITAAAALDRSPKTARLPCRYRGSPYRLTESRIDPPENGRTVSLQRALATSNNQCFAQLAVHAVGAGPLIEAIGRFGWLNVPARAHAAGQADPGDGRFGVGRLGCGLSGCWITPLHAAQLAATLAHGELVAPRWIERVSDANGQELHVPAQPAPREVLPRDLTNELRAMLVETTRSGTARRAFRSRRGGPLLGPVQVAGKTGSLSGKDPDGRYEWFIGVAPADDPQIAIATVVVQGDLYWRTASQVAAEVLRRVFCVKGSCGAENANRYARSPLSSTALARTPPPESAPL